MRFGKTDISNTKRFDGMSRQQFASMFYLSMSVAELQEAWDWVQKQLKDDRKYTTRTTSEESSTTRPTENLVKSGKRRKRQKTSKAIKSDSTK